MLQTNKNPGTEAEDKERAQDFEEEMDMDDGDEDDDVVLQEDMEEVEKMMEGEIERLAMQVQPIRCVLFKVSHGHGVDL